MLLHTSFGRILFLTREISSTVNNMYEDIEFVKAFMSPYKNNGRHLISSVISVQRTVMKISAASL